MLVLSRKAGEKIVIGDDIVITIVRLKGGACRVGIQAPDHLRILRGELEPSESNEDFPRGVSNLPIVLAEETSIDAAERTE